jgi:hypothetical protein
LGGFPFFFLFVQLLVDVVRAVDVVVRRRPRNGMSNPRPEHCKRKMIRKPAKEKEGFAFPKKDGVDESFYLPF